jgi:hypothetical protein
MGRITIFNTFSAVFVGGIGAAIGALFGRDLMNWGILIGGISGFIFPFYPIMIGMLIRERFTRRDCSQTERREDEKH